MYISAPSKQATSRGMLLGILQEVSANEIDSKHEIATAGRNYVTLRLNEFANESTERTVLQFERARVQLLVQNEESYANGINVMRLPCDFQQISLHQEIPKRALRVSRSTLSTSSLR